MIDGSMLPYDANRPALVAAIAWVQELAAGAVGTSVAVIAVAWLGLLALTGRIELRRGGVLLLGCFVLFGAPVIAAALQRMAEASLFQNAEVSVSVQVTPMSTLDRRQPPPTPFDPYAGASIQPR